MRPLTTAIALILAGAMLHAEDTPPAAGANPPAGDPPANAAAKPGREGMKAMVEKAFTDADANKDGKLDRAEFEAGVTAINAARAERAKANGRTAPPAPTKELLDDAFKKGDADSDGTLDKAEFQDALKALRPPRKDKGGDGAPPPPPAGTPPPAPGDAPPPPPAPAH